MRRCFCPRAHSQGYSRASVLRAARARIPRNRGSGIPRSRGKLLHDRVLNDVGSRIIKSKTHVGTKPIDTRQLSNKRNYVGIYRHAGYSVTVYRGSVEL